MNAVYEQPHTAIRGAARLVRGSSPRYNHGLTQSAVPTVSSNYGVTQAFDFTGLEFRSLSVKWKRDTLLKSNVAMKAMHPAYQAIISMGESAIPYILQDMQRGQVADWFWALNIIARHYSPPNTEKIAGHVKAMAEAWIQWGKQRGYLNTFR